MRSVYASNLIEVSVVAEGVAWIRRTARPSREGEAGELEAFAAAVATLPAARMVVIVDTRDAPGRNDEEFEHDILPAFRAVTGKFARQILLVRTEVGKIQAKRLQRETGVAMSIFTDEAEARQFAIAAVPRGS